MSRIENVVVELSKRQVFLLLEYSYPFEAERNQLEQFHGNREPHKFMCDTFYLPKLVSDLVYSAKQIYDGGILDELDELSSIMELAIP